jgi:hypothetical protein
LKQQSACSGWQARESCSSGGIVSSVVFSRQVMLVVDGAGESGAKQLPSWEGLEVSSVAADRGNIVPTDLVVSINLR